MSFIRSFSTMALGLFLLIPASTSSANGIPHSANSSNKSTISIPFRDVHHELVVTFSLNGHKGKNFLIDSGFGATILNTSAIRDAHLKTIPVKFSVESEAGNIAVTQAALQARIDGYGLELRDNLLVGDLELLEQTIGIPLEGIIGFDFLNQSPFLIDYSAKKITIFALNDEGIQLPKGIEMPLEPPIAKHAYGPVTDVQIELPDSRRVSAKVILDTGSTTGITLHAPFLDRYGLSVNGNPTFHTATGYGGTSRVVRGVVTALWLGNLRVAEFPAFYAVSPAGMPGSKLIDGEIGYEILSRFRIYVDAPHQRVVFEPIAAKSALEDK